MTQKVTFNTFEAITVLIFTTKKRANLKAWRLPDFHCSGEMERASIQELRTANTRTL